MFNFLLLINMKLYKVFEIECQLSKAEILVNLFGGIPFRMSNIINNSVTLTTLRCLIF